MKAEDIRGIIAGQLGEKRSEANTQGVVLDESLVGPEQIQVIDRSGETDQVVDAWLVMIENPKGATDDEKGHRIVAKLDGSLFGLALAGLPEDSHLVCIGWYDNFKEALEAM